MSQTFAKTLYKYCDIQLGQCHIDLSQASCEFVQSCVQICQKCGSLPEEQTNICLKATALRRTNILVTIVGINFLYIIFSLCCTATKTIQYLFWFYLFKPFFLKFFRYIGIYGPIYQASFDHVKVGPTPVLALCNLWRNLHMFLEILEFRVRNKKNI